MSKKVCLITGSSRGLGKALAKVFADAGYDLLLACRHSASLYESGYPVFTGDLRDPKIISQIADAAKDYDIDVLINNAAIYISKPFAEMTSEEVQELIGLNLIAPIQLTMAVWPIFKAKGSGTVININSRAGKVGSDEEAVYCASKFGLRGFSESLQFDATRDGVRVLNANIGAMKTEMVKGRGDYDKFIDPCDAARAIYNASIEMSSLRISEINILRREY